MSSFIIASVFLPLLVAAEASAVAASAAPTIENQSARDDVRSSADEDAWTVQRVGGDESAAVTVDRGAYRFGRMRVEASLPAGYPAPTPPGALELKRYPAARRAEIAATGDPDAGRSRAFWPLFQHIKRNDIAMTSPVEFDLADRQVGQSVEGRDQRWTMSFLYRTPDLGTVGADQSVQVVDTEPMTVLAFGVRGPYQMDRLDEASKALAAWLEQQDQWQADGEMRVLFYNGPSVRSRDKWAELQVPVVRVPDSDAR